MSVQVSKPFIKRKDMDAVLTCLVEDHVAPGDQGNLLVAELGQVLGCHGGVALRDPLAGWRLVSALLCAQGVQRLGLPALANREIYLALDSVAPVLIDVRADLPVLEVAGLEAAWERQPFEALALPASLGFVADLDGILDFCTARNIILVEDISQAFHPRLMGQARDQDQNDQVEGGQASLDLEAREDLPPKAEAEGLEPGLAGALVVLHTEADSALTTGGGCLVLVRSRSLQGLLGQALARVPGSSRMGDMNAALGRSQLKALGEILERKAVLYASFEQALMRGHQGVLPRTEWHLPHVFPLVVKSSVNEVCGFARKKGIDTAMAFADSVIHDLAQSEEDLASRFPNAHGFMMRTVLFPLHGGLHQRDIDLIRKVLPSLP